MEKETNTNRGLGRKRERTSELSKRVSEVDRPDARADLAAADTSAWIVALRFPRVHVQEPVRIGE